ncbi:MAG: EutN/CcmL family microcompartment protein [Melioribacteraceae bacterium]|nr:EutN/CcmL family microcompartment protein [Melioribacteraceae bacterium]
MILGKVIGTIWATRKYDSIKGYKMQFVQPLNSKQEKVGRPIVALDTIGAGPGEIVFILPQAKL